ncbi:CHAT domain-containing protein [Neolewinella persica]|uniref:CHAT domain-containing protein n=1 Tax=Neolewinella persica TaxID=70998 RepID=UPI0003A557D0|nr:CHAT domain-containing protein [Neolewinella persica]
MLPNYRSLTDLLAEGHPNVIVHALGLHSTAQTDDRFQRLLAALKISTAEHVKRLNRPHQNSQELERERYALLDRLKMFVELFNLDGFAVEEKALPHPTVQMKEKPVRVPLVLFLGSNPEAMGRLQLDSEYVKVTQQLQNKQEVFQLRISPAVTRETFEGSLAEQQPAIIHFSGHGLGEATGFRKAGLVFEHPVNRNKGDIISAKALAKIIKTYKEAFTIRLVVLNACESTDHAREISCSGLYAIGMTQEVLDRRAIVFAAGFYRGLSVMPDNIPFAFRAALDSFGIADVQGGEAVPKLFLNGAEVTV